MLNKRGFAAIILYRAGDCSIHLGVLAREDTRLYKLTIDWALGDAITTVRELVSGRCSLVYSWPDV
jgi:hypothetical protein